MIRIFDRYTGRTALRRVLAANACALLLVACGGGSGDGGITEPPPPEIRSGEDDFSTNTITRYTASSDFGTPWAIRDGRLIGDGTGIQSVLIRDGERLASGWVETRSSYADDAGLVLGYLDNQNYYLFTFRDDSAPSPRDTRNLAVYQRINGSFEEVWTRDITWARGEERTFRLELRPGGTRLRVFMGGILLAEGPVQPNGGRGFGLRHYGGDPAWQNRFDVLRWEISEDGN